MYRLIIGFSVIGLLVKTEISKVLDLTDEVLRGKLQITNFNIKLEISGKIPRN